MASDEYLNTHIEDIYRMLREFNQFQPILIYYKISKEELIKIDKQTIKEPYFVLNSRIFKRVDINKLNFTFTNEYKYYGAKINGFDCNLLSFVGSYPYSSNLFYICQQYNIFIPRTFYNKFIDPKDKDIYKNIILDECQICKKIIPPNSISNSHRKYHSYCDRKIRFIQNRYKTRIYNPYTECGRRFIWKIAGYNNVQ